MTDSRHIFQNVIQHVFFPPQLPQNVTGERRRREIDSELVRSILESIETYKSLDSNAGKQWNRMSRMLSHVAQVLDASLETRQLQHSMSQMENGDVLALHIRAQNCAVIIRKQLTETIFEVFEVDAFDADVMSTSGKIARSFPERAVEVPNMIFEESGFYTEIANLLVQMDKEVLKGTPGSIPNTISRIAEFGEYAHPHYITHLFLGILCGMGKRIKPRSVGKRIASEIQWNKAAKPWRRSPIWLIIRVTLQTSLSSTVEYKHFMIYYEAQLLRRAIKYESFSSDLLFVMRVKMARRLYKVRDSAPDFIVHIAQAVASSTEEVLQGRWNKVQLVQAKSPDWKLAADTFKGSVDQSLLNSRTYLESVFRRRSDRNPPSSFQPSPQARLFDVQDFSVFGHGALTSTFSVDPHVALFDFEHSVHCHLTAWTSNNLATQSASGVVASCLKQYTSLALPHYTMDASDKSIMMLTTMALWVALDRLATFECPLLLDYSPEIEENLVESLLLRTSLHISQARAVQMHLRDRHSTAQRIGRGSAFTDNVTHDCLAVRYFRQSSSQQMLKQNIEREAQRQWEAKLEEMRRQNEKYHQLVSQANQLCHQYATDARGHSTHVRWCEKCMISGQASNMRIDVFEWPLPSSEMDAEAVVFELMCPNVIRMWRDETYKILCNFGSAVRSHSTNDRCSLADFEGLREWTSGLLTHSSTITIALATKSFIDASHSSIGVPTNKDSVCLKRNLPFRLHDSHTQTWAAGPFVGTSFAKYGTLDFPKQSPYQHLRFAAEGTDHTSNQIIADQFDCPKSLSLHEHVAFGTLRSGPRLQWMNIVRGLEENSLTFNRDEVNLLHTQAAWQIGPLVEDGHTWDWHTELESRDFGRLLVAQSLRLLQRVKANWLEATSVRIIIMLVVRLLASTRDTIVHQDAYMFLRAARDVTFRWLRDLLAILQALENDSQILEYQGRVCEMAAICRSTYDVDPAHLDWLLSSNEDFSALIICSINLFNNQPHNVQESPCLLQTLICRDRRLTHKTFPVIASYLSWNPRLLDSAVVELWPSYHADCVGWANLPEPNSRWVLAATGATNRQTVHLNLLEGRLLVDGKPPGRLPWGYVSHPSYARLFGQKVLDVVPASSPSMEFTTRARVNDCRISFALDIDSGELLIQAEQAGRTYRLIPHTILVDDFPLLFSSDYHHWANLQSRVIEFRPLDKPWEISPRNWQLRFSVDSASVMELVRGAGSSFLANVHGSLFQSISQQLAPLESSRYIHVTYSAERNIAVELPRMKLWFFVNDEGALESHNLSGQILDENQSSGTMLGLRNQLLLRAKNADVQRLSQTRTVLIPYGKVDFSTEENHVFVTIDTGTNREVIFHQYKVDPDLRYLAASTGLTSRLFKIYLHALTSHCLPDPLTGRTGTEEALYELSEPATSSFEQITREQAVLLKLIGALTPLRDYYPPHLRSMQTIHWSSLSPLSQHYAFATATQSILRRANALRLFHSLAFDPMSYAMNLEQTLLERAAHRSQMYYPPGTAARLPTVLDGGTKTDHPYASREYSLEDEAMADHCASWAASLACGRWGRPTYTSCNLVALAESWGTLKGPSENLSLSYSSSWLGIHLPSSWLSIYNLCRQASLSGNQYQLAVCLASATYSNRLTESLLHALLAFATNPTFRSLAPPSHPSYQLTDNYEPCPRRVELLVSKCVRDVSDSLVENEFMRAGHGGNFAQTKLSYHKHHVSLLTPQLVTSLIQQWPDIQPRASDVYSSWFKIELCLSAVHQYFASCSRNCELRTHLQHVENVLASEITTPGLGVPIRLPIEVPCFEQRQPPSESLNSICIDRLLGARACPKFEVSKSPPKLSISTKTDIATNTSRLESLLAEFQGSDIHPLHARYGRDLEASRTDLAVANRMVLPSQLPASKALKENYQFHRQYMSDLFTGICNSLGPSTPVEHVISTAGIWPCRTPRAVLGKLSLWGRQTLPQQWKEQFLGYARAFVDCQRAKHLIRLSQQGKHDEFFKEWDAGNTSFSGTVHDADWLLLQIDGNFRTRSMQSQVANEMIYPSSGANTVLQLNMGEGKSSVVVPIVAATLADRSRLVRVVVLKPLWRQMFQLLVSRLAGLVGRRVYYLPFGRHILIGRMEAQLIQDMHEECMRDGGILLVQPEQILSFKLSGVDRLISLPTAEDSGLAYILREMQSWLVRYSRDILDESDEILHVRYQLVYSVGQQQPLEDHPNRWIITQQLLSLVDRHASALKDQFNNDFQYETGSGGRFPFIRIMPDAKEAVKHLILAVAENALDGCIPMLNLIRLSSIARLMALRFLTEKDLPQREYSLLKEGCEASMWKGLLLLRGLLAYETVVFALKEKHYRVDYGLDPSRSLLAVPYLAKDIPSLRTEFSHPDLSIVLTCLSYYYQGLTEAQLDTCFELLYKLDNPSLEYDQWVRRNDAIPKDLRHLNGINTHDRERFAQCIVPNFAHNVAVINFFMAVVVFPKEAKEFPHKLATSGWDLAEVKKHLITGFSGTNDNRYLLPTSISQCDPVKQSSTNALVLTYLLQPENNHYACARGLTGEACSAKDFLKLLVKQDPEIRVLLDVGAQMLELKNEDLVHCWLQERPEIPAAVFINDKDELVVLPQAGVPVPLISSPFAQQLDECIVYLDDGHTRGTDLKLPKHTRAAVTLGPKVTKDRLLQGCMRMRKLGHGQSVMFFAPYEIDNQIRKAASLDPGDEVNALDIIRWAMLQTCKDLQHHISHWAQQGVEHERRAEAEHQYAKTRNISVLREGWTTVESRSLEEMYGMANSPLVSSDSFTALACSIPNLRERLDELCVEKLEDLRMDEEQEREVNLQVEYEQLIERLPKSQPAIHSIHPELRLFVSTGSISSPSSCFAPLLLPLQALNIGNLLTWSDNLLATADFSNTLANSLRNQLSNYMRPLNWVISGPNGALVALSPYEVNMLLPEIRTSKVVQLHIYTPRVFQSMRSFSHLQFYTVPEQHIQGWSPPSPLVQMQMNLWAGQLYFEDYEEYRSLCAFLGVYLDVVDEEVGDLSIQNDGFVLPAKRDRLALQHPNYSNCVFLSSPVGVLKELIACRRKGMEYVRTHVGQVLHAHKLIQSDFSK